MMMFFRAKKASFLGFLVSFVFFGVLCYFLVQSYERPYQSALFFLYAALLLAVSAFFYSFIDVWRKMHFLRTFIGLITHGIACAVLFVFLVSFKVGGYPEEFGAWFVFALIAAVISVIAGTIGHVLVRREAFRTVLGKRDQQFPQPIFQPFVREEAAEKTTEKRTVSAPLRKGQEKGKRFCIECGTTLEEDDLFCPNSGKEVL